MDGSLLLADWWRPGPSTASPPSGPARAVTQTALLTPSVARSILRRCAAYKSPTRTASAFAEAVVARGRAEDGEAVEGRARNRAVLNLVDRAFLTPMMNARRFGLPREARSGRSRRNPAPRRRDPMTVESRAPALYFPLGPKKSHTSFDIRAQPS